ncbi:MAG: tRNA dihydrouridine synthase DusB [Chitinophagales bacterium]|nr:tRNA dihydrouridine synthase DusB [Chitinophagales bacterium]MDW8418492.1 tRNA dihydrouridine synthase DusB [Chitinophagales bacterium]
MVKIGNVQLPDMPLLLAPMEDVSDPPFRHLCKKYGADMLYTEFISADGLIRDAEKSVKKLDIFDDERPIGIQIFGGEEEAMMRSAAIVERANPELLDINYGCPVKNVVCRNAGAGILRDIDKMVKLTAAVVKSTKLPVTVKTRLGWDDTTIRIVEVAERLQDVGIQAISIHCRTRHQMYTGSARWEWIARVKENPRIRIPVFGNGDVDSPEKALEMVKKYGADGVMIGRAAIGYPFIFREIKHFVATGERLPPPTLEERLDACRTHLMRSIAWKGTKLGILEMRRHYGPYFAGLPGIKNYRARLVTSDSADQILEILDEIQTAYTGYDYCATSTARNIPEPTYGDA